MNLLAAKNNLEAVNLVINLEPPALMYTCKYIYIINSYHKYYYYICSKQRGVVST